MKTALRPVVIGFIVGLVIGIVLTVTQPVIAQQATRLFGTSSTGAAVPLAVDASGRLIMVCQ